MKKMILALFLLTTFIVNAAPLANTYRQDIKAMTSQNHHPLANYEEARAHIMQGTAMGRDAQGFFIFDVYCQKKHRDISPSQMPNHNQINIEHTWPKARFNKKFSRDVQINDLHHLYPTNSKVNGKRASHMFAQFPKEHSGILSCTNSKIGTPEGTHSKSFEPPTEHKGNVARALFYFALRYDLRIKESEELTLKMWNIIDPVDEDEMARNDYIEKIQGNRNPFIDDAQYADLIPNF